MLRVALALWLCLVAPPIARAGDSIRVGDVIAHGWSPWPSGLNKGQYPIFVELRNEGAEASVIDLVARCSDWSEKREVRKSVALGSGMATRIELTAPLSANWNSWGVSVEVDHGAHDGFLNDVGGGNSNLGFHAVLVISGATAEVGAAQRWTAEVSTVALNGRGIGIGISGSATGVTTSSNDNIQFGAAVFDELASTHAAYSCLDLAVLDTRAGMPNAEQLAPLLDWVRLGGELLLIGPQVEQLARQTPALAVWIEPRFRGADERAPSYACALGRVWFDASDEPLFNIEQRDLVRHIVVQDCGTVPAPSGSRVTSASPTIPGLGEVPHRSFAALLILFALVIGPINFIAVKRTKKPVLLLITIPSIALVTSLVLLFYGVFVQGLDVKTGSCSIAVLDQREHRSVCVEKRLMFAGLSPSGGLRPGPGTAVFAIASTSKDFGDARSFGARERLTLRIDQNQGRTFSADYLPTRVPVMQVLHCEQAARGRLDVRADGESYSIENGLGVDVSEFVLRDLRGDYFKSSGPLEAGAKTKLEVMSSSDGARAAMDLLAQPIRARAESGDVPMPAGCYAAALASGVFRDECGIDTHEKSSAHRVLGVLAADDGAWR